MACIEKLAAIMNLVSVERDWVIVVARSDTTALRSMISLKYHMNITNTYL